MTFSHLKYTTPHHKTSHITAQLRPKIVLLHQGWCLAQGISDLCFGYRICNSRGRWTHVDMISTWHAYSSSYVAHYYISVPHDWSKKQTPNESDNVDNLVAPKQFGIISGILNSIPTELLMKYKASNYSSANNPKFEPFNIPHIALTSITIWFFLTSNFSQKIILLAAL